MLRPHQESRFRPLTTRPHQIEHPKLHIQILRIALVRLQRRDRIHPDRDPIAEIVNPQDGLIPALDPDHGGRERAREAPGADEAVAEEGVGPVADVDFLAGGDGVDRPEAGRNDGGRRTDLRLFCGRHRGSAWTVYAIRFRDG